MTEIMKQYGYLHESGEVVWPDEDGEIPVLGYDYVQGEFTTNDIAPAKLEALHDYVKYNDSYSAVVVREVTYGPYAVVRPPRVLPEAKEGTVVRLRKPDDEGVATVWEANGTGHWHMAGGGELGQRTEELFKDVEEYELLTVLEKVTL